MASPDPDPRKRKRMLSNRESARRSRQRKKQRLDELVEEVARLREENGRIGVQIEAVAREHAEVEAGNLVLRTQMVELVDRLRSVNSVLRFVAELNGMAVEIPEVPDPLMRPWELPCPVQGVVASARLVGS